MDMENQINMFDQVQYPKLKLGNNIRLIELFAGIGAQAKSLENLGVNFEHYRICEFDKYAVKSYNAVHGTNFEVSDITKIHAEDLGIVDTNTWQYIMTYSFPCTDLSNAGKQAGMSKGSGTRSGLLWEVERLLTECLVLNGNLPQILLMENVPQVHGVKNLQDFNSWISFLSSLGYTNVWKDLNAKDFGVPQNRNRCYMVSFLGNFSYTFPSGKPLEYRLKDYLEDEVDEKYYLSDEITQRLLENTAVERERDGSRESETNRRDDRSCDGSASQGLQGIRNGISDAECSHTVRAGGRGSVDRHSWDLVKE